MKRIILAALLGVLVNGPAAADPGPVVNWLSRETASVFVMGMYHLNMELEKSHDQIKRHLRPTAVVSTNTIYDHDEIRIRSHCRSLHTLRKSLCRDLIQLLRIKGGVADGTLITPNLTSSYYSDFFRHHGYSAVDAPKDYLSRLDHIGLPPLSWSTVNMSKTEDQRCRTSGISRKRLSRNCGRLRFSSVKVWRVSIRSERSVLSSRRTTAGGSCMAVTCPHERYHFLS